MCLLALRKGKFLYISLVLVLCCWSLYFGPCTFAAGGILEGYFEGRGAKRCIHLLKFAELPEFPGGIVDLSDVLNTFANGRCQARMVGRSRWPTVSCADLFRGRGGD